MPILDCHNRASLPCRCSRRAWVRSRSASSSPFVDSKVGEACRIHGCPAAALSCRALSASNRSSSSSCRFRSSASVYCRSVRGLHSVLPSGGNLRTRKKWRVEWSYAIVITARAKIVSGKDRGIRPPCRRVTSASTTCFSNYHTTMLPDALL